MSEPTDKELHERVRQKLLTYRPPDPAEGWEELERALRRRRWGQRLLAGALLLLVGVGCWLFWAEPEPVGKTEGRVFARAPLRKPTHAGAVETGGRMAGARTEKWKKMAVENRQPARIPAARPLVLAIGADQPVETRLLRVPVRSLPVALALPAVPFRPGQTALLRQLQTGAFGADSTLWHVLNRNLHRWSGAVVVADATSSMEPYSAQLFTFLQKQARRPAVSGFVFFTDCDSLGRQTEPGGLPGKMFVSRPSGLPQLASLLLAATGNTVGNEDDAENTVEALLEAQTRFPDATRLILIADNASRVKDLALLSGLVKPVEVVLCGSTSRPEQAYQPDYEQIARATGGSLHTLEDDIPLQTLAAGTCIRVGDHYYRYKAKPGRFKLTRFRRRPLPVLKVIWL